MGLIKEIWMITREASVFLVIGFFLAGVLRALITEEMVGRYLGGNGIRDVFLASLIGIPLPLCSCGVLPAAVSLRKQGASRAATSSFLISTPETGVDSIAVSYAFFDLVMVVFRPLAALFTALATGAAEHFLNPERGPGSGRNQPSAGPPSVVPFPVRLRNGLRYSFLVLLADLSWYLFWGLLLAGAVSYALPEHFFQNLPGGEWTAITLIIAVGTPLYVCATSSTPLAAALMIKGLSPGAVLVLMLVGPATNISSLAVLWRIMSPKSMAIYLGGVIVCALASAYGLNLTYGILDLQPSATVGHAGGLVPGWLENLSAAFLCLLMARGIYLEKIRPIVSRADSR